MQRPIRTRRLSVAAIASLVGFVMVASAGVRSFWTLDELDFGYDRAIALNGGCLHYAHSSFAIDRQPIQHRSMKYQVLNSPNVILGFGIWNQVPFPNAKIFRACTPIWPFLLLLLIAPLRWLVGRPAVTSAFAIITSTESPSRGGLPVNG
jgi:hypothetical protein